MGKADSSIRQQVMGRVQGWSDDRTHNLVIPIFRQTQTVRGRRSAWLGRQIVNLEVAGSNPVGPANFPVVWYTPFHYTLP